ncbi:MAG: hypothetical protein QOE55_7773 [Acidobacteriaceae bacterium]|nr:hypothetical protein [Acidobacteriaceae bacterium]
MYAEAPAVAYKASWRGFFEAEIAPRSKSDFSNLPDGSGTLRMDPGGASGSRRVLC